MTWGVIVSGAPGAGKTTVAKLVADHQRVALLSLDSIKESLADALGLGDEDWSNRLGDAAGEVLFGLAASFPAVIIETWWRRERRERAMTEFSGWIELFCWCPPALVADRMRERITRDRHPIHRDVLNPAILEQAEQVATSATPLDCGSRLIRIDTSASIDVPAIAQELEPIPSHVLPAGWDGRLYAVVSGPPGSGKTTLAASLGEVLRLPVLSKDAIKEPLMDVLVSSDVDASRSLGRAAMAVLFAVAGTQSAGAVLESNFHRALALDELDRLPGAVVEVFCRCDREIALSRYRSRTARRHPGHFDELRQEADLRSSEVIHPVSGGWPVIEVDTNAPVDVAALGEEVRRSIISQRAAP